MSEDAGPFEWEGEAHSREGDCAACWWSRPDVCGNCGGRLHTRFGDENYDGDYWLEYRCQTCGSSERP